MSPEKTIQILLESILTESNFFRSAISLLYRLSIIVLYSVIRCNSMFAYLNNSIITSFKHFDWLKPVNHTSMAYLHPEYLGPMVYFGKTPYVIP